MPSLGAPGGREGTRVGALSHRCLTSDLLRQ